MERRCIWIWLLWYSFCLRLPLMDRVWERRESEREIEEERWLAGLYGGIIWHLMDRFVLEYKPGNHELGLHCSLAVRWPHTVPHFLRRPSDDDDDRDFQMGQRSTEKEKNQKATAQKHQSSYIGYKGRYWVKAPCILERERERKWTTGLYYRTASISTKLIVEQPAIGSSGPLSRYRAKGGQQCDTRTCQYLSFTQ